jgi:ketosteroid isomerase-like protein
MANTSPQTDNGRLIASLYDAFGRGDIPFVMDQLAPDVEWIETESPNVPTHGTSRTPQEVLENVFMKLPESFGSFEVHPDRWIESTDDVVVTGRIVARAQNGRELDAPFAHVFTVRDGKVTRNDLFNDSALWVSALA